MNAKQEAALGIETAPLVNQSFSNQIVVSGTIEAPPQSLFAVTAKTDAYIKKMNYYTGDQVKKGSVLCEIEHPKIFEWQKEYKQVCQKHSVLKKQFERGKQLLEKQSISERDFDQLESDYQQMSAEKESLEANFQMLGMNPQKILSFPISKSILVKSPTDGIIGNILVKPGQFVSAENTLYEIIQPDHLHLELSVFISDLSAISVGDEVEFSIPGSTEIKRAKVHLLAPTVGTEERSAKIHAHLSQENDVKATIFSKPTNQIVIQNSSVLQMNEKEFVVAKEKEGFCFYEIKTIAQQNGKRAIIFAHEKPNGPIVVSGITYFLDQGE
jgi:cobalt-zinc-cadmium efflux system membrane fusion protein